MELKRNQRQENAPSKTQNVKSSRASMSKVSKKRTKGKPTLRGKKKSKKISKEKRDNNYVMKRAHTVLKRCCWAKDRSLREVTRIDLDGSMDYFVRLLCRLEASNHLRDVVQMFHDQAQLEIRKVRGEIEH